LIAILLKKLTHLPLVVDFRDAWTDFNVFFWNDKPNYFRRFEGFIEKKTVENADKIISVNENIVEDFRRKYTYCSPEKFVSITNGYDPEDFTDSNFSKRSDNFLITYAGSLYEKRSPENFLKALKMLLDEKLFLNKKVCFQYIGKITSANEGYFQDNSFKEIIKLTGELPHKECLRRIKESDLLLFIEDQVEISDRLFPAKIFEYIASGRPILALAKEGLASDLIRKTISGIVLENHDIPEIKDSLLTFITNGFDCDFSFNSTSDKDIINQYSREATTRALAQKFNEIIEKNKVESGSFSNTIS
jgi:glycosyltransferase involved in cell wall biosynthesis